MRFSKKLYICSTESNETENMMMNHFDINQVIKCYNPDVKELAKVLFPDVRYPDAAFNRIVKGEAALDVNQLEALADYIGVPVKDLFSVSSWKGRMEDGCIVLIKGDYKVKLNYKGTYLTLYKKHRLMRKIVANTNMTLEEFVDYIDNLIKNY